MTEIVRCAFGNQKDEAFGARSMSIGSQELVDVNVKTLI